MTRISHAKLLNRKRKNHLQPKQYFDFYLHSKDEVRRGECLSPRKQKLLKEISKSSEENQGFIFKKSKINL